jgi:hypothetical protein
MTSDIRCVELQSRGSWREDAEWGRCSFPIGPVNTISNIAYVLAGVVVALTSPTFAGYFCSGAFIALGIGSGLYHGLKRGWTGRLDVATMYVAFAGLFGSVLPMTFVISVSIGLGLYGYFTRPWLQTHWLEQDMGILLGLALIMSIAQGAWEWAVVSVISFVVGYLAWQLDYRRLYLGRWGHGIWHVMTAMGFLFLWMGMNK